MFMKSLSLLIIFLTLTISSLLAQSPDPIVFSVNGKPVYKSEFEAAYKKNNLTAKFEKNDIESFLQSYINSKLSLEEALTQKLDTTNEYKYQCDSYRIQVTAPYLENREYADRYFQNLYNQYLEDVELNHAFIPFGKSKIFPSDTLNAYNVAMVRYNELKKNKFKESQSIDYTKEPSLETNLEMVNGYLGWVPLPMLSTAINKAILGMSIGEISKPIRTMKGYHIIQLLAKRPAIGYRTVDQVVFGYKNLPPTKQDIDSVTTLVQSIYSEIDDSYDFQNLCDNFSEAHGTGSKGCRFGEIGLDAKLPASFINEAFRIENVGDISRPVVTNYGVHILRLVSKRGIPPKDEMEDKLFESMQNGDKGAFYTFEYQKYFGDKYDLVYNKDAYLKLMNIANSVYPTDSSFVDYVKNEDEVLFTIDDTLKFDVKSFLKYLLKVSSVQDVNDENILAQFFGMVPLDPFTLSTDKLESLIRQFATTKLYAYLQKTIDKKIPGLQNVINEYAEGTLIFDVKKKNIWSKVDNEALLQQFFEKNKTKYKWDSPRYKGYIVSGNNELVLDTVRQALKRIKSEEDIRKVIRDKFKNDTIVNSVEIEEGLWSKGQNKYVDYEVFSGSDPAETSHYYLVVGKLIRKPEVFEDVKGEVIADYQNELEKQWLKSLREKYDIVVNESVLRTIETNE